MNKHTPRISFRTHKAATLLGTAILSMGLLMGCGNSTPTPKTSPEENTATPQEKTQETPAERTKPYVFHTERHVITDIRDEWVYGENVEGTTDGVSFYSSTFLEEIGRLPEIHEVVEVSWIRIDDDGVDRVEKSVKILVDE